MSATGSFFSSLLGTYANTVRAKHKDDLAKEERNRDAEIEVLKAAVSTGRLDQDSLGAAFSRMEELTQGGSKGKKKGGFSFKNLIGQFSDVGQKQQQPAQPAAARKGGTPTGGPPAGEQATATEGERSPVPARPQSAQAGPPVSPFRFRSDAEMNQSEIDKEKMRFEQIDKQKLDYEHKLRMEEIDKQYGSRLTWHPNVKGAGVGLQADSNGKPIDPNADYIVGMDNTGRIREAIPAYQRPASTRATGPEAKVDSLKKDIMAEAQAQGRTITEADAEIQARRLMLAQTRAQLAATLESTRGKVFANKVRADLEKGVMTPATARGVISFVGTEAKRRFADDMATIASGKSIAEIEDEVYGELGTSREQIATYLRQGAAGPKKDEPPNKPKARKFDSSLNPVPARPSANP